MTFTSREMGADMFFGSSEPVPSPYALEEPVPSSMDLVWKLFGKVGRVPGDACHRGDAGKEQVAYASEVRIQ